MKLVDVDLLLARAQVSVIMLFSVGFFAILFFLMVYHKEMTSTEVTILTGLLSSLATIVALQQNFLFARTRPPALPDPPPSAPTVTGVFTNGPSSSPVGNDSTTTTLSVQSSPPGAPSAGGVRSP